MLRAAVVDGRARRERSAATVTVENDAETHSSVTDRRSSYGISSLRGLRECRRGSVKGLGHEAIEKGKQIAAAAADSLEQGAEAQGLSAATVADKVRDFGRGLVETVKTEA